MKKVCRLLLLLGLFAATASADVAVTGFNLDSFGSCDTGGGAQFKISGTELGGGECVFTNSNNDEFSFTGILNLDQDLLCSFDSVLEPDVYAVSVRKSSLLFTAPSNLTVYSSPLSPSDTVFVPISTTYAAGQEILFEIVPYSSCASSSICDSSDPDDFTFTFAFNAPSISVAYLGKSSGVCQYQATTITLKGNYTVTITIQNSTSSGVFAQSSFSVVAGISSVNQSMTVINTTSLSTVTAGAQACVKITLYDSYGNTVNRVTASQFSLSWVGSNPTVQQKSLQGENDGEYTLCFLPTKGGSQSLEVKVNNVALRGSPIAMTVQAGTFSPTNSLLVSSALCPPSCSEAISSTSAVAGVQASLTIVPLDEYKNQKTTTADVNLSLFSALIVGSSNSYNGTVSRSGSYLLMSYTVEVSGVYSLHLSYNGTMLSGGTMPTITVSPSAPSMAASSFNSSALSVVAGDPFEVVFTARDSFGNLASGFSAWLASVSSSPPTVCSVAEGAAGIYTATCTVTVTGSFQLSFRYDGTLFPQTKPIHVVPATVSASSSFFAGFPSSLVSNASASLIIYTRDLYGNSGGTLLSYQRFQIQIQPKPGSSIVERFSTSNVTEVAGDATALEASFSLKAAGNYTITVQLNGASLSPGEGLSPSLVVLPGPTQASRCTLAPLNDAIAALPVSLQLQAKDAFGNLQALDERALFGVNASNLLDPSHALSCPIALTSSPGIYSVTCLFLVAGPYSVVGSYQGLAAFTTTNPVEVVPGAIAMTTTTFDASSTGQLRATAGVQAHVRIQGRDVAGNALTAAADFEVTLQNGEGDIITCSKEEAETEASGGISVYGYQVTEAGNYSLAVRHQGSHIAGSPSILTISPAPADISSIAFEFSTAGPFQAHVGREFSLSLVLADQFGNPVGDGDDFSASLIGSDFAGFVQTQPLFLGNGRYRLVFLADVGGLYALTIVVNDVIVPQNISVEVLSDAGGNCTGFQGSLNQGQRWELICTAYDKYGKEKLVGGDLITYDADHGSLEVTDHGDGRYTASYSSQAVGKRNLTVYISGRAAADMPLRPVIIPGAVVLGTVIPAIFVAALLAVGLGYYLHRRKVKQQQLQNRKRKPQQVFKPGDEGEWSDEEDQRASGGIKDPLVPNDEMEEQWFSNTADGNEKVRRAHSLAMFELEGN